MINPRVMGGMQCFEQIMRHAVCSELSKRPFLKSFC